MCLQRALSEAFLQICDACDSGPEGWYFTHSTQVLVGSRVAKYLDSIKAGKTCVVRSLLVLCAMHLHKREHCCMARAL